MTSPSPSRLRPLLAAALAAAACNYSYQNPADGLSAGEIEGRASVPGAGAAAGVSVSVQGSALDQASRPSGRFGVLPLPQGEHRVLLRQGLARAAFREVSLGYGSDGRVEGVWLGDLSLPRAVSLSGSVAGATGSEAGYGVLVDEVTGISATLQYGSFVLDGVAVGDHRLLAFTRDPYTGATYVGQPMRVTVAASEEGTEKALTGIPIRTAGAGTGHLYFRVASLVEGLDPADAVVHLVDWMGAPVAVPAPDSNGDRDLTLTEGAYFLEVLPPPAFAGSVTGPARRAAVVVADDGFDLGTLTLADDATLEASRRSCRDDADCTPGTCATGVCTAGYTPPTPAPATATVCDDLDQYSCSAPGACDLPGQLGGPGAGSCIHNPVSLHDVCVPCSTSCTIDGVAVLTASACSY